ncbi:O-antigen ligase family protein [Flammeovirga agarivorans]|nr:O-antigen ligase family protein [Flammeovirga agarivorans]
MTIIIIIKNIVYVNEFIESFKQKMPHPYLVPYFYGGGSNLEASWYSMNVAFFSSSNWKKFYSYFFIALFLSFLYSTRAAIVILFVILFFRIFTSNSSSIEKFLFTNLSIFSISIGLPYLLSKTNIIQRFSDIGHDPGSLGRFKLWGNAFNVFQSSNGLGLGAGNAIFGVESYINENLPEDNLHNIYLQFIVDFGLVGILLFLIFIFFIIFKAFKNNKINDPLFIFSCTYLIGGMIQFRGPDTLFWFIVSIFISTKTYDK